MDLGIQGKCAVVAGGSSGLGFGTAAALVEAGARIAICGRDRAKLDAAASTLGDGVTAIVADLATAAGASTFVSAAREALGQIDILVANAGGPPPGMPSDTGLDAFQAALDLNLLSTIALAQAVVAEMRERRWGRIVAITSIGARQPIPVLAASSVARAGVSSFVRTLATEVAADGVTVNSAQPGLHATDRVKALYGDQQPDVPVGFLGDPADFGKAVAFLCSEPAKFITGTSLLVDGGAYPGL